MIMRSPRPAVDIRHKLVNSLSLKKFLKCQAQILMHFVTEGELVSLFSTPGKSYSHVLSQCHPRHWRGVAAPSHDLSLTDSSTASHSMKTAQHKKKKIHILVIITVV